MACCTCSWTYMQLGSPILWVFILWCFSRGRPFMLTGAVRGCCGETQARAMLVVNLWIHTTPCIWTDSCVTESLSVPMDCVWPELRQL